MTWENKRVVILGVARQGTALARYLVARGARVTLSDMKAAPALAAELAALDGLPITFALGGHPLSLLDGCDLVCLSGGVPIDLPIVLAAHQRNVPLSNDAQIFFDACPAPIIGITGSAGKTTTTTLVGEMLRAEFSVRTADDGRRTTDDGQSSIRVWVGGNIGNPLIADVQDIGIADRVVMELSSFQLELMTRSPHIACVTNITPNHLDRHGTMDAYITAKRHILDYQRAGDWDVLSADDPVTSQLDTPAQTLWFSVRSEPQGDGAWLDEFGTLRARVAHRGIDGAVCHLRDLLLMGEHNVLNVLAASAISALAGASLDSMRAVATTFRGVAHRLQLVRQVDGVRYYDGSIATAPERLMADLRCFSQPVVLLCGGRDKHLPWAEAVQVMRERCRHVALFGEMAGLVRAEIERQGAALPYSMCDTLEQAVAEAARQARPGDVVLLSPGGTSFDAFKDFAERGDRFVQLVNELVPTGSGVSEGV
jgi:UDP-N-acetylmuramoylalanine--D-glutamate ligase